MPNNTTEQRTQEEIAADALDRRRSINLDHRPPNDDHASGEAANTPRPDQPPSGAFDAEGHRPALERSRKVR